MAKRKTSSRRKSPKVRSFGASDFRHKAYTLPEQIGALRQFMSLSQISRETGVPRSTLARYAKGGAPGGEMGELYAGIIASGFSIIHRETVRERAKSRSVNAIGKRVRVMKKDPSDPKRKKKIASDSSDYAVMNSSDGAILRIMYRAAERARLLDIPGFCRFLILGDETDPQYAGEYFWTEAEALADLTREEIADVLAEARARGTLILMRIQDRG